MGEEPDGDGGDVDTGTTKFEDSEMSTVANEDLDGTEGGGYGDIVKGEPEDWEEDVVPRPVDEDTVEEVLRCEPRTALVLADAVPVVGPEWDIQAHPGQDLGYVKWAEGVIHGVQSWMSEGKDKCEEEAKLREQRKKKKGTLTGLAIGQGGPIGGPTKPSQGTSGLLAGGR